MAENNAAIYIVLKMIDEGTPKLKAAYEAIKKDAGDFQRKSDQATDSLNKGFKEANKQLRDFRRATLVAGIAIAAVVGATKTWSERNQETKNALDQIFVSGKNIAAMIGQVLGPGIIALSDLTQRSMWIIKGLFDGIRTAYEGVFKGVTFLTQFTAAFLAAREAGVSIGEALKVASNVASSAVEDLTKKFQVGMTQNIQSTDEAKKILETYNNRLNDAGLLFKSGGSSAQEYFDIVMSLSQQQIFQNEIIAGQIAGFAQLYAEVSNVGLMAFQAEMQGRTDLLNTYKGLYIQGHADMFAAADMMATQFHTNMSTALSSIILGEKKASDAMGDFGKAMVKAIVDYMVQQAVAWAVSEAMKGVIFATTSTMAIGLANMWAPAAALASLATAGGNAVPAMTGMATTTAAAYALAMPKAMAHGGEGVVTRPTLFLAGEAGPERFRFTPLSGMSGARNNYDNSSSVRQIFIDIKVDRPTVRSEMDIDGLVREISRQLANEVDRIR